MSSNGVRLLGLVLGFWVLMRSINADSSGRTLIDHLVGNAASVSPLLSQALGGSTGAKPGKGGQVDPVPGSIGSRLDQGIDVTGKSFLAPFTGKVVVSNQSDSGWQGGGYIAIANAANPNQVVYMAEGIAPLVSLGQTVQAGQAVGKPVTNPYNGIVGNIEIGPADPASPGTPLAKSASNPAGTVEQFYHWLLGLGGPKATSTGHAGYA